VSDAVPPEPAGDGRRRGAALAAVVLALTVATFLAFRTTREGSILGNSERLLLEILGFWAAWAVAVACLLRTRLDRRQLLVLVVLGAAALRLAAMTVVVPLSDDLYRYAWDGSVQASGTSPYRYAPPDPALDELRTDWLFPDAVAGGDTARDRPRGRTAPASTGRRSAPSTRPGPGVVPGRAPGGASELRDLGWQVVALVADVATCVLLWQVLVRRGRDPRWVAVFAWSPTAVLEGVQNAHVDGLATFFVVAAVAWAGRRPAASGAALGAAAMVKLYPALLLPLLLGRRPVRVLTAFAGGLRRELPAAPARRRLGRPGLPARLPAGGAVRRRAALPAAAAARSARPGGDGAGGRAGTGRGRAGAAGGPPGGGCAAGRPGARRLPAAGAALLLASPVQPWYGLPLVALAALARRPVWAVVPALTYPLFFAVIDTGPSPAVSRVGSACYLAALAVVLLAALRRRRAAPPAVVPSSS
jgi:hypothetical protein